MVGRIQIKIPSKRKAIVLILFMVLAIPVGMIPTVGAKGPQLIWNHKIGTESRSSSVVGSDDPSRILKWMYNATDRIRFSPVVGTDGTAYLITDPFGILHAINPDGTLKWKYETGYTIYFPPTVGKDSTIYLSARSPKEEHYLLSIGRDGTFNWQFKVEGKIFDWIKNLEIKDPPLIGEDGTIYLHGYLWPGQSFIFAINPDGTVKWEYKVDVIYETPIWGNVGQDTFLKYPLLVGKDGTVYFATYYNLCAFDPSGSLRWRIYLGEYNYPILGKDSIYVIICNSSYPIVGDIYLYSISMDGTVKWHYKSDDYWNDQLWYQGDSFKISPLIGKDNTIYITITSGFVYQVPFSIVYAINPDGTLKWKYTIPFRYYYPFIGPIPLMLDDENTLHFLIEEPLGNDILPITYCLYAIESDGSLKWKYEWYNNIRTCAVPSDSY